MQRTRKNCFGSNKLNTILLQLKIGKQVCRKITAMCFTVVLLVYGTRAYLFWPDEKACYVFSTRNNCCEFLVSHGVILQTDIQPHGLCSKNVTKKRFLILFCQNPDDIGILLNFLRWQLLGNISCFLNEASELLWQKQNNFELALTFFAFVWIDFFD